MITTWKIKSPLLENQDDGQHINVSDNSKNNGQRKSNSEITKTNHSNKSK